MKLNVLFAMAFCGVTMISCNENEKENLFPEQGDAVEVSLQVNTSAKVRSGNTELGTDEENTVDVIEFYVFDKDGALDPRVGDKDNHPGYLKLETDELVQKIIVTSGTNKKFVALLNMNLGGLGTTGNYDGLKAKLSNFKFTKEAGKHNSRVEEAGQFEMSGETSQTIDDGAINVQVDIPVKRLVSRINAPVYSYEGKVTGVKLDEDQIKDLWGDDSDKVDKDKIKFVPNGYAVINGLDRSDAFFISNASGNPETFPWNSWTKTGKIYLTSEFRDGFYTNNYSAGTGATTDCFLDGTSASNAHRVYVFENKPQEGVGADGQRGYLPETVYAIMLKGQLIVEGEPTLTKTRYWRIPLTYDQDYHIIRNSVYEVYLKNITSIGSENPEDAEKPIVVPKDDSSVEVRVKISEWDVRKYPTEV